MMSDEVKAFLLGGHSPIDQNYILNQIYINEVLHKRVMYQIDLHGCWYIIAWGQILSSSTWPKPRVIPRPV